MMAYGELLYSRQGGTQQRFTLELGSTTIGREQGNDLTLDAEGVSGYHARIICTPAGCAVTDLGSTNGTFLNQLRLKPRTPQPLRHRDILRIGPFVVLYLRAEQPDDQPKQSAPPVTQTPVGSSPSTQPPVLPPEV